jgi:hypothetical protein
VLCSAAVITATIWLAWVASGVAALGLVFMALGLFAPQLLHFA